jgi:serine/threonine protein phosphatase PrpC
VVEIFDHVGSGSYGTVHFVKLLRGNGDEILVGKRAWTPFELQQQNGNLDSKQLADKSSRCLYYWMVEKHCFQKIPPHKGLPFFRGVGIDEEKRQWILSNKIQHGQELAISLQDYLEKDRLDHKAHRTHHLYWLSLSLLKESQAESTSENSLAATLDIFFQQLLEILSHIHEHSIVHRDIKPANLLVADGQLVLIDFGSAADLETAGLLQPNIGLSDRVAISPIYVAPELFVDPNSKCACNFDCFSAALLFCQLLFQFLDERTESGFHQQLKSADYDLDTWLQTALSSKVRPAGIDDALEVLEERPGLWKLLNGMLQKDPHARLSSKNALKLWSKICQNAKNRHLDEKLENELDDGLYLKSVLESLQVCEIPKLWPLHFVATFKRSESLGLYLAEADAEISESDDVEKWIKATKDASPGDVFVQAIVPGGQADQMGCFAVGDRLQGVGEIPISGGGFKKVVELLKDQPRSAKYVALHFDRLSAISDKKVNHTSTSSIDYPISISDKGAWTIKGRRKVQEDAYVLHEVHDDRDRSLLLAGVFDGHLGTTAANFLQKELPVSFCAAFKFGDDVLVDEIIEKAWNETCDAYRLICDNDEECKPYYDPREGTLMANTGSEDAVSGSTATVFAVDTQKGMIATLNCGDSRGIIVDSLGNTKFQTKDHKPEEEIERFLRGKEQGLDYCIPQCKVTRWTIEVGDYDYAVARSLEGPFATSKGVISLADVETIQAEPGMTIVIATDGLWEVIDIEETSRIVPSMRKRMKACDLAKHLCALAYEKSATDNVSVVILYVD